MMDSDSVAIMMCTLNGVKYIKEQMESLFAQSHGGWQLWVSDDGSTDGTIELIRGYENRGKAIHILSGPKQGFAANFLSLARKDIVADYYAWSDQDDVWLPDKISRGISFLSSCENIPSVYCGRTQLIDRSGKKIGLSRKWPRKPSFQNALCQNIVSGNTVIFNRAAKEVLSMGPTPYVPAHDWWVYLLVSGLGGKVIYDPDVVLLYRQHSNNALGDNHTLHHYLKRIHRLFSGGSQLWVRKNTLALKRWRDALTQENRDAYDLFSMAAKSHGFIRRMQYLLNSGVYRQFFLHNMVMYLSVFMNRFP